MSEKQPMGKVIDLATLMMLSFSWKDYRREGQQ
jgi:hypothetical protein